MTKAPAKVRSGQGKGGPRLGDKLPPFSKSANQVPWAPGCNREPETPLNAGNVHLVGGSCNSLKRCTEKASTRLTYLMHREDRRGISRSKIVDGAGKRCIYNQSRADQRRYCRCNSLPIIRPFPVQLKPCEDDDYHKPIWQKHGWIRNGLM